jgi:hypothetical protein
MLVPLPSDMLAARAAGGFTSATSTHFCIGCDLTMNHIEEFDKAQWPQRDHTSHLQHAHTWKNATTVAEQEKIALKTGIRYSVLLELPYWKAVRFVLIEPMHILDLRLIEIHCRELLRIDLDHDGGDGSESTHPIPPRPSVERMETVLQLFKTHRDSPDLMNIILKSNWANFAALWHICKDRGLRTAGNSKNRAWFVLRIWKWVSLNYIMVYLSLTSGFQWMAGVSDDELMHVPAPPLSVTAGLTNVPLTPTASMNEIELESCQLLLNALRRGTKATSLAGYPKKIYEHLCHIRNVSQEGTKLDLYERLLQSVCEHLSETNTIEG